MAGKAVVDIQPTEKSGAPGVPRWLAILGAAVAILMAVGPGIAVAMRSLSDVPDLKAQVRAHQDAIVEMRTDIRWIARRLGKKD